MTTVRNIIFSGKKERKYLANNGSLVCGHRASDVRGQYRPAALYNLDLVLSLFDNNSKQDWKSPYAVRGCLTY